MRENFQKATTQAEKDRWAQKIINAGGRPPRGYGQGLTGGNAPSGGLTGAQAPNYSKIDYQDPASYLPAQQAANVWAMGQNIGANRLDEQSALGSLRYETDPATGRTIIKKDYSPEMQARFDAIQGREMGLYGMQNQMMGGLRDQLGRPLDFGGLPEINKDYSQDRQRVEDSIYNRFQRRFKDQFAEEKNNLQQQLADRGIPMGSERYNKEMQQLSQRQNDATLNAQAQAIEMGGQEQQNLFNMGMQGRQQGINERLTQRSVPLSEYGAIQGFQQGVIDPNFNPTYQAQMQAPDIQGAAGQYQQGQLTREQMANQEKIARIGASTAGSSAGIAANSAMQLAQQRRQWDLEDQAKLMQLQNANKPNPWVSAGAGLLQGVGAGLTSGLLG